MHLGLNKDEPLIMHIDLNSCFATIEQQANRLIRDKPVGVAAYDSPGGIILAASYEAKALGIKLGTRVGEARAICPKIFITTPDPEKYREAHRKFKQVLLDYTDEVVPKSIDEFVIDFRSSMHRLQGRTLESIGYEIKERIYEQVGEAVRCNVGIGTSRFWAKTAAGLHKPNGLDMMSAVNARETYAQLKLTDLCGINVRYEARLKEAGIMNSLDFLQAERYYLEKRVFKSIVGYYWYLRLRGHEIDNVDFGRKSYGHQYALGQKSRDVKVLRQLLMKLCEKTGRRLRKSSSIARSLSLYIRYENKTHGGSRMKLGYPLYSTQSIYEAAKRALETLTLSTKVTVMSITVSDLEPADPEQLSLLGVLSFDTDQRVSNALDSINSRYGEFTIASANMSDMGDLILDRIAFGNVKEL